jgi:hypothetical protein
VKKVTIRINNWATAGEMWVRRLRPRKIVGPDTMCEYEWDFYGEDFYVKNKEPLKHRYGDGAWALVAKVIQAANDQETDPMIHEIRDHNAKVYLHVIRARRLLAEGKFDGYTEVLSRLWNEVDGWQHREGASEGSDQGPEGPVS